jgi:PKD repeat protein
VNGAAAATANVTVAPPLVGAFSASKLAGLVPLTVTFNASASGGVGASAGATHWSFGNGLGASGSFVSTTYTSPGEYVAIASLSDRGHGNASEAFVIDAESPTAPGVGVTATVTPAVNVSSGETVAWSASRVGPPAALARTLLAWQFGNGGSAFGPAANETVFSPSDVPAGDRLTAYVELDNAIPSPILRVALPLPGFFAQEAGGFVPAVDALGVNAVFPAPIGLVPFSVTGSVNATGPGGTTVTWTFGDGTNSSAVSFHHVYYGAGEYTVRLQAHDGYADSAVRRSALVANAALAIAGCGPSGRHVAAPYTLHLEPTVSGGTGPPYGFLWTLPNGTQSNATNVTLTFSSAGTYGLTLVVTDAASAAFTCSWAIVVVALPPVTFLEIVAGGVLAGIVLAVVFVVVTRPPPGD